MTDDELLEVYRAARALVIDARVHGTRHEAERAAHLAGLRAVADAAIRASEIEPRRGLG